MRPDSITQNQWVRYNLFMVLEHFLGLKLSEKHLRSRKEKLYNDIIADGRVQERQTTFPSDIVERECDDVFTYFEDKSKLLDGPLVFRKAAMDWPCVQTWDKKYFRDNFSDYHTNLVGNVGLVTKESELNYQEVSLAEYLDRMYENKENYLRFSRLIEDIPELQNDLDMDWMNHFKNGLTRKAYIYLFMGKAGSKTPMHNGIIQSLFVQIQGRKKWTIYPPNERIFLDVIADRRPYFHSNANPNELDDAAFPLLKYAKKYEIILEEGDVLWFPAYYWHYVENLTENIGVTYKWTNVFESFKLSSTMTSLFFLATKPNLIESLYNNTFRKKDVLFEKRGQMA